MTLNVNKTLVKLLSDRLGRSATRLELIPRIQMLGPELASLTDQEKASITGIWGGGGIGQGLINFDYWRFYKTMTGSEVVPALVPDNIYWGRIIRALNPASLTRTYINKSLYPIIFKGLKQPEMIVNVINGVCYNGSMDYITQDKAARILGDFGDDIIVKPTTATSGGRGVTRIKAHTSTDDIRRLLPTVGRNYICQRIVRQSPHTAIFNESSLNTFRVNTVNINGRTTCECLMMRHGLNNNIVDNFAAGGIVCGMDKQGHFNGNNYNNKLKRVDTTPTGLNYTEMSVPGISDLIAEAVEAHQKYMPHIGHAAWDFALDSEQNPVMIEVNLMLPGILMEQLTSGAPIFGERTDEVISYAMNRNKTISWTEFVGGWE